MGIIDKLVTGPYWRKCETVENILDLNPAIEEIQRNCLSWSEDSERPHATTLNLESTILFETNQIAPWLSRLDDSTKNHYVEIAGKSAKTVLKDYQKCKMDIEERSCQNMLAKQKKSKKKNEMP